MFMNIDLAVQYAVVNMIFDFEVETFKLDR